MSMESIRVAYFSDTYLEIDGVANTARQFEAFARRRNLPFLLVHGGYECDRVIRDGNFARVELKRSFLGFPLDRNHDFDLTFVRHLSTTEKIIRDFRPGVLHITGPSDVGILGALVAHRLKIPLVGSWHTNLHQYAERRALPLLRFLPVWERDEVARWIRERSFAAISRFYTIPRVLLAPNRELIDLLIRTTGKPCFLMARGVDSERFHPCYRERRARAFTIGYVGRITVEKNADALIEIEKGLRAAGMKDYRFLVVGQGARENYLRANLQNADLVGVLQGERLAKAYANMDVFLFPSKTDTFGNVVLEAMASGVPALVTDQGGPQFIVTPGVTGYVCENSAAFVACILRMQQAPEELETMQTAARKYAEEASWDNAFSAVYGAYEVALQSETPVAEKVNLNLRVNAAAKN